MTVYRRTRDTYQRLLNRRYWHHRQGIKELYREFVAPGSVAFDIGAHRGEMTGVFRELGAHVVAVEPNATLSDLIRSHHGSEIVVENVAVGARPGTADLHLGRDPGHSTLSDEWLRRAPTGDRWQGVVQTEVTTLDLLIAKHGTPDFVKIDVEGYEAEVLEGLSVPIAALSFEYQVSYPEIWERCLILLPDCQFALSRAEEPTLATGWLDACEVTAELRGLEDGYGNVFVRRLSGTSTLGQGTLD